MKKGRGTLRLSLAFAGALCACAGGTRSGPLHPGTTGAGLPRAEIRFPPETVVATPLDLELSSKNDEELFAVGTAAFGARDFPRAAAAFARIFDVFPSSAHAATALFNAGLAYEKTESFRLALERFRLLSEHYEGPDAIEASFRVAECLFHLNELDPAREELIRILGMKGLSQADRVRALTQRGVVEFSEKKLDAAEGPLRQAVQAYQAAAEVERLDGYFGAQAQYYLGEIYGEWFRALPLDPEKGDESLLAKELEDKAEMLLSAQGHYLQAIRLGNDTWAVASGFRIGELYDGLHTQLVEAKMPPGLSDEESAAYQSELRQRVKVLATKAITAYEQTLERASKTGVDDLKFLADAQASLDRLRRLLREDAAQGTM